VTLPASRGKKFGGLQVTIQRAAPQILRAASGESKRSASASSGSIASATKRA
jgi:hypothetical protein